MSLLETTKTLLSQAIANGLSLRDIAPEDGDVEYEWLKKFIQLNNREEEYDPSVGRVQSLHDRLVSLRSKFKKSA
jgi:hypothetical protein